MVKQEEKVKSRLKVVPWGKSFIVIDEDTSLKGGNSVQHSGEATHSKRTREDPS